MLRNPFMDLEFIEPLEDSLLVKFTYLLQNIYCRESHLMQYHQLQDIIASQKKKKKKPKRYEKSRATKKKKRNGKNRRRRNERLSWFRRRRDERIHVVGPPWRISSIRPTHCIHNATTAATTGREKACSCWLCTRWFV